MKQSKIMQCKYACGFTLVEVIFVIVILGIVASIGASFVSSALESYQKSEQRHKLVQRGRLSIEQVARELRMSVPNSIRVSSTHLCIEFMPIVSATRYLPGLATAENNATSKTNVQVNSVTITSSSVKHIVVSPLYSTEVYTSTTPAARATIGSVSTGSSYTSIPLSSAHTFLRESPTNRLFLGADPVKYCVSGGQLLRSSGYGLTTSSVTDSLGSGAVDIVSLNVLADGDAFTLSPGAEDRNASVDLKLLFSAGTEQIDLHHRVLIRNVP